MAATLALRPLSLANLLKTSYISHGSNPLPLSDGEEKVANRIHLHQLMGGDVTTRAFKEVIPVRRQR
jgi:hypothetical protein